MQRGLITLILALLVNLAGESLVHGAGPDESGVPTYESLINNPSFKTLPKLAADARPLFALLGMPFLVIAVASALGRKTWEEQMKGIITPLFAFAFMVTIPFWMNKGDELVRGINSHIGLSSPSQIAKKAVLLATVFQWSEAEKQAVEQNKGGGVISWILDTGKAIGKAVYFGIRTLCAIILGALMWLLLWICSGLIALIDTLRFFLWHLGSILLPFFIAGLCVQTFRSQATNYIFTMLGIMLWPLGWSLGHIGTLAIFDWACENISTLGGLTTNLSAMLNSSAGSADLVSLQASAALLGVKALGMTWTMIIQLLYPVLILAVWIIVVTLTAPAAITYTVVKGAGFFDKLSTGTLQTSAKAAGGAMSGARLMAMQGGMQGAGGLVGGNLLSGGGGNGATASSGNRLPSISSISDQVGQVAGTEMLSSGSSNKSSATPSSEGSISSGSASSRVGGSQNASESNGGGGRKSSRAKALAAISSPAGFALSRTLLNAANWDGSPESFSRVPDSGLDESLDYQYKSKIAESPEPIDQASLEKLSRRRAVIDAISNK